MDIQGLREATSQLSAVIENVIKAFEAETDTTVSAIDLQRMNLTAIGGPAESKLICVDVKVEI